MVMRSGVVLIFGGLIIFGAGVASASYLFWRFLVPPDCTRTTLQQSTSPAGRFEVGVVNQVCPIGFSVVDNDYVSVWPASTPGTAVIVLTTVWPRDDKDHPQVAWSSEDALSIDVSNRVEIIQRLFSVNGISVALRFHPDDPVGRADWLKRSGLPTDARWP